MQKNEKSLPLADSNFMGSFKIFTFIQSHKLDSIDVDVVIVDTDAQHILLPQFKDKVSAGMQ